MATALTPLDVNTLPDGLLLTGAFLSAEQKADRHSPDGSKTYKGKYVVTLLVGDRTFQIEYRDENNVYELTGYEITALDPMARVALPVGVRSAQGYTFYYGRRP